MRSQSSSPRFEMNFFSSPTVKNVAHLNTKVNTTSKKITPFERFEPSTENERRIKIKADCLRIYRMIYFSTKIILSKQWCIMKSMLVIFQSLVILKFSTNPLIWIFNLCYHWQSMFYWDDFLRCRILRYRLAFLKKIYKEFGNFTVCQGDFAKICVCRKMLVDWCYDNHTV